jgi:hypothetical protein
MTREVYDNSGAIFVNDRKEKDSHPDRSGQAMIDGREYWVSGWLKKDRNGNPFLSLAFKLKGEKPQPTTSKMQPRSMKDELDEGDEIPF